jgi:hypothetical protein
MPKNNKYFTKDKIIKLSIFVVAILLVVIICFFAYLYFISKNVNTYVIKNQYFGFEIKTPKNWFAEENTSYSADSVDRLITRCINDKTSLASPYQIGAFRFKDYKFPQNLGVSGYFPDNIPTGAILEVTINCMPNYEENKPANYGYSNLKIGGAKAVQEFINLTGFGKTKYLSFFYKNIWYQITEYVYVSPEDKNNKEANIRDSYNNVFNKIISSFKFVN